MKISRIICVALLSVSFVFIAMPAQAAGDIESNPVITPLPVPDARETPAPAVVPAPAPASKKAEVSKVPPECDGISNPDRQNLCLAKVAVDKEKKFGYENKDHRNYYCSIIKDRDLQTYCFAVVGHKLSNCNLIVDPGIENECKASF